MVPKILYVEDNDDIRFITSQLLEKAGYSVTPAANGLEALEIFNQREFQLIITDIYMPRMDGNELIQKLSEGKIKTPILVLTYNISEVAANSIITLIAIKPLIGSELRDLVSKALGNGRNPHNFYNFAS